ncbi:hypothetical protein GY45DRAFT_1375233 [Cubamyces sp. BRFM 1775]|nr:hypothetical protein GY45DRAFT_1375233 [Cubamyces sp. BRFM 1775]
MPTHITARVNAVRGDDGGALHDRVISYLRDSRIEDFKDALQELPKFLWGWCDGYTARMLCPQKYLLRFDDNALEFCQMVLAGPEGDDKFILQGGNFPSFLYDQNLADPEDSLKGLLWSPYFLTYYKSLWTGPSSARLPTGHNEKTSGCPPIAWANSFLKVTPRTLAYTTVQVQYELTSRTAWSTVDVGGFDSHELYEELVGLFSDKESEWCCETLVWWQKQVFTNVPDTQSGGCPIRGSGPMAVAEELHAR